MFKITIEETVEKTALVTKNFLVSELASDQKECADKYNPTTEKVVMNKNYATQEIPETTAKTFTRLEQEIDTLNLVEVIKAINGITNVSIGAR